jgi:hypothetical protein
MKNIITLIITLFVMLFAYRSQPSVAVGFNKTTCIDYKDMDYHHISIPFQGVFNASSEIDPDGMNFHAISRWDPSLQKWITSSYKSEFGWQQDFPIFAGQSYMVHSLISDFNFISNGKYEKLPSYNLITSNPERANMNLIMVPLERYDLKWAGSGLGNDIGSCTQVSKLEPKLQLSRVTMFNGIGWDWDFPIQIGDPLMVDMSSDVVWPFTDTIEVKYPKASYWRVVKKDKKDYNIKSSDFDLTFKAWITGRENDIIDQDTYGCGFDQILDSMSTAYINFGNFKEEWRSGEIINIQITDPSAKRKGRGSYKIKKNADTEYIGFKSLIKDSGDAIVLDIPIDEETAIPYQTALFQNYPNPFNPTTMINFSLESESVVRLSVYNYAGQITNILINGNMEKGHHKVQFNAEKLSSGVYFYRLEACGKKFIRKMLIVR